MKSPSCLPNVGESLSDEELIAALTKIPDEGDPHINDNDRTMSQFVMDRIDQCFAIPDNFVYEVNLNGIRKFRTIHGDSVQPKVAFASTSLYRLLDMKMIARVGDYYYYSLRVRPEKKSSAYEYVPNKRLREPSTVEAARTAPRARTRTRVGGPDKVNGQEHGQGLGGGAV